MVSTLSKAVLVGVTCGALGVGIGGFWAFRDEPVRQEPMRTFIRPTAPSVAATPAAGATPEGGALPEVAGLGAEAPEVAAPSGVSTTPNAPAAGSADPVQVKRLVVTDRIEDREPVADSKLRADGTQVFAFVELANLSTDAQSIEIVF